MHEENLITEHRLPEHTHMHRHRVSSGTPALSDLSFSSFQERQLTEVGWRKKRVRGWGMNGVVVGGGVKESTKQWHWLTFLPSAHTVDKHCVLMSGSLIRVNKSSM